MQKHSLLQRSIAWIGILLILGLFAVMCVLGITGKASPRVLMGLIIAIVLISVILYAFFLAARLVSQKDIDPDGPEKGKKKN